jgi:hypothetical protein
VPEPVSSGRPWQADKVNSARSRVMAHVEHRR